MKTLNHHRLSGSRFPSGLFGCRERGFTLIELIIVVVIAGILLAAGVPSFRSMIITMRIKNASFDFYTSLLAARSEALTRNTTVTITPMSGTDWATGWNVTAGAVTLKTQDAFPGVAFIPKVSPLSSIVYNSSGRLDPAVPVPPVTLYASNATAQAGRCVTIDLSGRPVTTKGVCP